MSRYLFVLLFGLVYICLDQAGNLAKSAYFRRTLDMQTNLEGRSVPLVAGMLKWAWCDLVLGVAAGILLPISFYKVAILLALMLILRVFIYHYLLTEDVVKRYTCTAILAPIIFIAIFIPWLMIGYRQDPEIKAKLQGKAARTTIETGVPSK